MERRDFIQQSLAFTAALGTGSSVYLSDKKNKELYELRVYETKNQGMLDNYLSNALIPALNKADIKKVGVFNEIGKSEPFKNYLLIPYSGFEDFAKVNSQLKDDKDFQQVRTGYDQVLPDKAVYWRYDTSLMMAFNNHPKLNAPDNGPRIFELRTYEGHNEDAVTRKVKMFNEGGEIEIFNRVKLDPVFFGEVIAGKGMPCLTYMVTFKDMEERDKNWKAFREDADWQRISKAPEYANTVSRIYKTFLTPLPYSQI